MKNLSLLFIVSLLAQFTSLAQEGWFEQTSGVSKKLVGVSFADVNIGTVVGDGQILRTTDGGLTWDSLSSDTFGLWDVHFVNTNVGMAVGGAILRTTNGGVTWDSLWTSADTSLYGVFLTDENTGTVVGTTGTILRTTDGGTTWIDQSFNTIETLTDVNFTDANTGTVVGWGGIILRTINGGTTWVSQTSGTTNQFWGVWFTDTNIGTAVGRGGDIRRTTDGGIMWDSLTSGTTNDLWDVFFTDTNIGTVVGGTGIGGESNGEIYRTTDGGSTWVTQLSNYQYGLHGVSFTDANNGTVVGVNGTILRTTTGGVSFIEENEIDDVPTDFNLTQNFPNPFNPSTKIIYSVSQLSNVTIKIFDVLGNEIETLVSEEKPIGTYEITWYAKGLPSGVYFCQLKAGSFVETKKMVLLK